MDLFIRLRDSLRTLVFSGTSQEVFGNHGCYVCSDIPTHKITEFANASCWIRDGGSSPYYQNPSLFEQFVEVTIFVHNLGDEFNEGVMIARNKNSATKAGSGILEVEQEVINHIISLTALSSNKISFALINKTKVKSISRNNPAIFKTLMFSCIVDVATGTTQGDEDNILRAPGRFFWNPTDLTDNPGGFGTLLGYKSQDLLFDADFESSLSFLPGAETTGNELAHAIFLGQQPRAIATFLEHRASVISLAFPGMTSGTDISGYSTKTGNDFGQDSDIFGRLLFVPDDTQNNKILLLQKVVPLVIQPIKSSRNGNTEYVVKFQCFRKSADADGVYYFGDINNATLR